MTKKWKKKRFFNGKKKKKEVGKNFMKTGSCTNVILSCFCLCIVLGVIIGIVRRGVFFLVLAPFFSFFDHVPKIYLAGGFDGAAPVVPSPSLPPPSIPPTPPPAPTAATVATNTTVGNTTTAAAATTVATVL
jgi:hypothetical protein